MSISIHTEAPDRPVWGLEQIQFSCAGEQGFAMMSIPAGPGLFTKAAGYTIVKCDI